jgi:hypothetical protein
MRFSLSASLMVLLSLTAASPVDKKRATGTSASVLTVQTYDEFSVSAGVSGSALAEVNAKFPVCCSFPQAFLPHANAQKVDQSNLAGVSASDLAIISSAAQISEDAETGTGGFNDAIAAAGGTGTTAGKALQNGKIKNKVLKLQTDVLRIQIEVSITLIILI